VARVRDHGGMRTFALAPVVVLSALGILLATGCDGAEDAGDTTPVVITSPATTAPPPATAPEPRAEPPPAPAVVVGLYFAAADGRIVREERQVRGRDELRAAMEALIAGPADPGLLMPAVPEGTELRDARSDGQVATVDLSPAFEEGYPSGGSAAELAIVEPIVRTAAEAAAVDAVLIRVEGRAPAPTGTQFDFTEPLLLAEFGG
jgi:spore germination protein GerM